MKKALFILLLLINTVSLQAQNELSEKQNLTMLKDFYTKYITTVAHDDSRDMEKKLSILQKKYCTKNLLAKIPDLTEKCDCDPFLKAQDSDIKILKSLSIKRDSKKPNLYIVTYIWDEKVNINLIVIDQKDSFKIDKIW